MSEGSWRFDDHSGILGDVVFEIRGDDMEADWNLGVDGRFWLSGSIRGPLVPGEIAVDMRSLDATIAALTNIRKTFYSLDQSLLDYPLTVREVTRDEVSVQLALELDWDFHPSPTKPADYRTHHFSLDARARILRA